MSKNNVHGISLTPNGCCTGEWGEPWCIGEHKEDLGRAARASWLYESQR